MLRLLRELEWITGFTFCLLISSLWGIEQLVVKAKTPVISDVQISNISMSRVVDSSDSSAIHLSGSQVKTPSQVVSDVAKPAPSQVAMQISLTLSKTEGTVVKVIETTSKDVISGEKNGDLLGVQLFQKNDFNKPLTIDFNVERKNMTRKIIVLEVQDVE